MVNPLRARCRAGRRVRHGATALATVVALTGVAACSGDSGGEDETVKIGLVIALTGPYAQIGKEMRDGIRLYLDTHGKRLGGRKVELSVADEGADGKPAGPAAQKLIKEKGVDVLMGLASGEALAGVVPVANKNKIPLVGVGGRIELKNIDYIWHTSLLSDQPGASLAPYVKDKVNGPVYAIGPDYIGGKIEVGGFTDKFKEIGGQLANPGGKAKWVPFPQTTNFTPYLNEIAKTNAQAVYCFFGGKAAIDFVKSYRRSSAADLPLYAPGFLTETDVLGAQGKDSKGINTVMNYVPDLDNPLNRKFAADWTAKFNSSPGSFAMYSYDGATVLDRAIKAASDKGEVTSETINKEIGGLGKIDSPRGPWEMNKKTHTPVQKWYLRQVRQDGKQLANVTVQGLATLGQ
ncbi:ABC transporter substrate-binding protein [Streptomyces sp. NPDC005438]|uniref:ABC transporter substrate-binding protein n=1 Tax=Streptomyces sp. NPDC005438 TaxID=3156880 RepID=UPI0033B5D75A